jgi:hypothetical protein
MAIVLRQKGDERQIGNDGPFAPCWPAHWICRILFRWLIPPNQILLSRGVVNISLVLASDFACGIIECGTLVLENTHLQLAFLSRCRRARRSHDFGSDCESSCSTCVVCQMLFEMETFYIVLTCPEIWTCR